MKTNVFVALLFASTLTAGTAAAQPAPFNEVGRDHGSLAHRLEGCGSEQETLSRHGRQVVHARRKPADHVPGALYQLEPRAPRKERAAPWVRW